MLTLYTLRRKADKLVDLFLWAAEQRQKQAAANLDTIAALSNQNHELRDEAEQATNIANVLNATLIRTEES